MPFGLTNAPVTFVMLLNDILCLYSGKFIVYFIVDILVYNKSIVEHNGHRREVSSALRKAILDANKNKTQLCIGKQVSLLQMMGWNWIQRKWM